MRLRSYLFSVVTLSIALSGSVFAKKPEGKGNPHHRGSEGYWENSNKQSEDRSLRGRERAEERHYSKKYKKDKKKHYKHDWDEQRKDRDFYREDDSDYQGDKRSRDDEYDRYERQRYIERYQNDPVGVIVDENVGAVKSKVDNMHRQAIEAIDNKTREITGVDSRKDSDRKNRSSWWSIFGEQ